MISHLGDITEPLSLKKQKKLESEGPYIRNRSLPESPKTQIGKRAKREISPATEYTRFFSSSKDEELYKKFSKTLGSFPKEEQNEIRANRRRRNYSRSSNRRNNFNLSSPSYKRPHIISKSFQFSKHAREKRRKIRIQ